MAVSHQGVPADGMCPLCQGVACEVCCGADGHGCRMVNAGPESHKVCHRCGGSGLASTPEEVHTDG